LQSIQRVHLQIDFHCGIRCYVNLLICSFPLYFYSRFFTL